MSEQFVEANGIRLCYEEFGEPLQPAIVLIMGLGMQMIAWPVDFCRQLAAAGYRVVRFDNRDIGLSAKMDGARAPGFLPLLIGSSLGLRPSVPYTLQDMARDTVGLLDALYIDRAHLVGVSMGGMIAQLVAGLYPQRTQSLTSIMSTSGARSLPGAKGEVRRQLTRGSAPDEESVVANVLRTYRLIGSPGYRQSDEELRARITAGYRRSYHPQGFIRQFAAILASGDRVRLLRELRTPTLVIHGTADPLVPVEAGIHTAKLVPGARLELIDGMGHDLPQPLHARIANLIIDHVRAAGARHAA